MTLSLQEISDRMEIQDLLAAYCDAIDTQNWDALDEVFTTDAVIDYTEMGGVRGTLVEIKEFLGKVMPAFVSYQHLVSSTKLTFDGDTARGRTICHNPLISDIGSGRTLVTFCGLWYRDTFVRTADGWRISDRYEEKSYFLNASDRADG